MNFPIAEQHANDIINAERLFEKTVKDGGTPINYTCNLVDFYDEEYGYSRKQMNVLQEVARATLKYNATNEQIIQAAIGFGVEVTK